MARRCAITCVLAVALLGGCHRGDAPPTDAAGKKAPTPDDREAAELVWAREKAETFLRTLVTAPRHNDPTLAELTGGKLDKNWWVGANTTTQTDFVNVVGSVGGPDGAKEWAIQTESVAPDKDEALFRGVLTGSKHTTGFTLLIGKEGDGKWRVTAFTVEKAF